MDIQSCGYCSASRAKQFFIIVFSAVWCLITGPLWGETIKGAAANRNTLILMASSAAALILLSLLLGFVISWSFILPVQEAHGFLSEVAKGNFAATINVPNRDEFGALADRMNHMSQELLVSTRASIARRKSCTA